MGLTLNLRLFIFIMFMALARFQKKKMATVIGIFEYYLKKKPLPVVKPGSQTRRFTHIQDSIETVYFAWKKISV